MRAIICLLLFSLPAHAEKILFNLKGEQQLVEVGDGGGITDDAAIVWRERDHGPLPADAPIGYAERFEQDVEETRKRCKPVVTEEEKLNAEIRRALREPCEEIEEKVMVRKAFLRENAEMKAAKAVRDAEKAEKERRDAEDRSQCEDVRKRFKQGKDSEADVARAVKCLLKGK